VLDTLESTAPVRDPLWALSTALLTGRRLDWVEDGPRLRLEAEGNGFLYKMVRSLTGALVDVGLGRLTPADMAPILASQLRTQRVFTAPPQGLCLVEVFY
jgi:tRNA pseudouridine38-40 synthase